MFCINVDLLDNKINKTISCQNLCKRHRIFSEVLAQKCKNVLSHFFYCLKNIPTTSKLRIHIILIHFSGDSFKESLWKYIWNEATTLIPQVTIRCGRHERLVVQWLHLPDRRRYRPSISIPKETFGCWKRKSRQTSVSAVYLDTNTFLYPCVQTSCRQNLIYFKGHHKIWLNN